MDEPSFFGADPSFLPFRTISEVHFFRTYELGPFSLCRFGTVNIQPFFSDFFPFILIFRAMPPLSENGVTGAERGFFSR